MQFYISPRVIDYQAWAIFDNEALVRAYPLTHGLYSLHQAQKMKVSQQMNYMLISLLLRVTMRI